MSDTAYLDWAEKAAIENLRGRVATGDWLVGQTNGLLAILLVGIGGGIGYAVKLAEAHAHASYTWGVTVASCWLALIAAVLVAKVSMTCETPVVFNEPQNLYRPEPKLGLSEIRVFELENIQARIETAKKRNAALALWLDRCRFCAVGTPLAFAVASIGAAGL